MSLRLSAVDADEFRRRREDNMVDIRKNRREESLQKKRREVLACSQLTAPVQSASAAEEKLENLPAMVAGVLSDDNNMQLEATTRFRKLLSIEGSPPIEDVIQSGVVPCFVEFIVRDDFPQLQFEAAWALTIIALETMGGPLWFRPVPHATNQSSKRREKFRDF